MIEFKKITLESAEILRPYVAKSVNRLCDFSIGGTVMWRNVYDTHYAICDDALYMKLKLFNGKTVFTRPVGKPFAETYENILEYCKSTGEKPIFINVSNEEKNEFLKIFPDAEVVFERDFSDYIYLREDLANFKGKRYSGQRNHINRFMNENENWQFEEIGHHNLPEVKKYLEKYIAATDKDALSAIAERDCVRDVLENFDVYGFFGEALRINGEIVGFFLCEAIFDTLIVHIEKCERSINGAYQMLAKEEASKYCVGELKYVNREDDSGDEGLRKSKLSYHPFCIAEKYTITL